MGMGEVGDGARCVEEPRGSAGRWVLSRRSLAIAGPIANVDRENPGQRCTEEPGDGSRSYNMWHLPSRVGAAPSGLGQHGISPPAASPVSGPCSISCPGTVQHLGTPWHLPSWGCAAPPTVSPHGASNPHHLPPWDNTESPISGHRAVSHLGITGHIPSSVVYLSWGHPASPISGHCGISHLGNVQHLPSWDPMAPPILCGISHLVQHLPSQVHAAFPVSGPGGISHLRNVSISYLGAV